MFDRISPRGRLALALILGCGLGGEARAEDAPPTDTPPADAAPPGFWERDTLSGDWGGLRTRLTDHGIKLAATEISEILGNPAGGYRQGTIYEGRLELDLNVDLEKLLDWDGASIGVNAWQTRGHGLTSHDIGNFLTVSNIEAVPGTRLFDLWIEQAFFEGAVSVRVGQQGADDEFLVSSTSTLFVNSTFGFPGLAGTDLPSGGPAYPLATPAVRVKWAPSTDVNILAAAFNGDPAGGPGVLPPQVRDGSGTVFATDRDLLGVLEFQYLSNQEQDAPGLPGTYKLGSWYHSGRFWDPPFNSAGLQIADPAPASGPNRARGDFSLYAVVDQTLWKAPDSQDQGVNMFARIMGAPADRNAIDFYLDGGFTWKGPIEGREGDTIGIAFAYAGLGDAPLLIPHRSSRSYEALVETSYVVQVVPWLTLQPDLQVVLHPGGNAPNPYDPSGRSTIGDGVIFGLRAAVTI